MTLIGTRRALSFIMALAVTTTTVYGADGPEVRHGHAKVRAFRAEDGSEYFALSVKADKATGPAIRQHIVLFDTSASQSGEHRDHALAVLDQLTRRMHDEDRIALFAVDVQQKALTEGFVSPQSAEMKAAVGQLKRRIPLGASNLQAAMQTVLNQTTQKTATSVIYIGDGLSTANLIQADDLRTIVARCRKQRVAVSSYAVGPNRDLELLGLLALHTGGVVITDQGRDRVDDSAKAAGIQLGLAVHRPVTYLTQMPAALAGKVYPASPLPLRSDRDTVYVGRGVMAAGTVSAETLSADASRGTIRFDIENAAPDQSNAVLVDLINRAEEVDGFAVAVAGQSMYRMAQRKHRLRNSVRLAMAQDNGAALSGQDNNQNNAVPTPGDGVPSDPTDALTIPQSSADDQLGPPKPGDADVITDVQQRLRAKTQYLGRQVQARLREAERMQRDQPDGAMTRLKDIIETVKSSTDIDPDARRDMLRNLQNALNDVRDNREYNELLNAQRDRKASALEARQSLTRQTLLEEEQLQTLIETVRQHLEEARKGDDNAYEEAETVANLAIDLRPGNGVATQALFNSEAAGQLNKAYRLRALRADRFLETLYQVERSHVPFPDEPPVVYPPAEVWNALSLRRIERWSSVDLAKETEAARRIRRSLDNPTEDIQGGDSLKSILDFLQETHGFPIIPDRKVLSDAGIESLEDVEVPEDLNLTGGGITLKSALKIIFDQIDTEEPLTYLIKNEVMYITTEAEANAPENFQTRVYPVADLVIPIPPNGGGGLGGGIGGGGLGGGGLGGGGLGGGLGGGGLGGGGLGGGGFGGGGGAAPFSIPPEDPATMITLKKKH